MRLEPRSIGDAIELGYHAGNLHWRVRYQGEALFVALEGRPEEYTAPLGEMISARRVGVSILDEEEGEGAISATLEHDPEKWRPVFRKDHAQTKR
jgi:urease accessory protein